MLTVQVRTDTQLIETLANPSPFVMRALEARVRALAIKLEAKIKSEKLSGQVLNVRSGALRRSIAHDVMVGPLGVVGRVFSSANVPYARIHEFGGRTGPHTILPTKASVLAFTVGGRKVFAKRVNHPGSKMPERSYMRTSLHEMQAEIVAGLQQAFMQGLSKG